MKATLHINGSFTVPIIGLLNSGGTKSMCIVGKTSLRQPLCEPSTLNSGMKKHADFFEVVLHQRFKLKVKKITSDNGSKM